MLTQLNHTAQLYLTVNGSLGVNKITRDLLKSKITSSSLRIVWAPETLKTQYLDNNVTHKRFGGWRHASPVWKSIKGWLIRSTLGEITKGGDISLRLWCFPLFVLYEEIVLGSTFFIVNNTILLFFNHFYNAFNVWNITQFVRGHNTIQRIESTLFPYKTILTYNTYYTYSTVLTCLLYLLRQMLI